MVTVKNGADTIKQCIESVLKQTYKNYKVYVIDAFSTDGTYEILKKYRKKIKLEQLKGNPPTAYNYAISKINSKFVAFTNADCVVEKNWLEEILKPFSDKNVAAVAGFVKNPKKTETKLQEMIGRELEYRYKSFPKEISRAPEMNLCVRTDILKKLKFDTSLDVSYDADFGYRLSEFWKFIYQPSAIVYHYHRPSWKNYFKQQYKYAKFVPKVYLKKYRSRIIGDNISKTNMMLQLVFIYLLSLSLLLTPFYNFLISAFYLFILLLVLSYFKDLIKLCRKITDILWFLSIFFVRNVAWSIGILVGIYNLITEKVK